MQTLYTHVSFDVTYLFSWFPPRLSWEKSSFSLTGGSGSKHNRLNL
jgi:hypothetical protein